ncbi:hypothetical protein [Rhodococcus sp. ACS1]|uniref:hypothetical protein n=1 Tax=Rhodococcus sp. ACS1 TaxID=2028570 RepID=UPI00117BCBF2|nr:hypothetical protein [Rhodococcus sp. ACS1]
MKAQPSLGGGRNGLSGQNEPPAAGGHARHLPPDAVETDPAGELRAHKIGTCTRRKSGDVIDYREKLQVRQRAAFDDRRGFEAPSR